MENCYIVEDSQQQQPYDLAGLQKAYAMGTITSTTYIRCPSAPEARVLKEIPELMTKMPHLATKPPALILSPVQERKKAFNTERRVASPARPRKVPLPMKQFPLLCSLHQVLPPYEPQLEESERKTPQEQADPKDKSNNENLGDEVEQVNEPQQIAFKPRRKSCSWQEYMCAQAKPYFYNEKTGLVSPENPEAPPTVRYIRRNATDEFAWLRDTTEGYIPVRLLQHESSNNEQDPESIFIETVPDIGMVEIQQGYVNRELLSIRLEDPLSLCDTPTDLVNLDDTNTKQRVLHAVRTRFLRNQIYTNVGQILISVNPFKSLPCYTPEFIELYRGHDLEILPPHVFAVAATCYRTAIRSKSKHSIIISGESGAGKTEATKLCLQYFSEIAGTTNRVEQMLLACSPILEAFGNAKTCRNYNSSRFGKYIELFFDRSGEIDQARITSYLLEKSRIVHLSPTERNFHVLYQLCRNRHHPALEALDLDEACTFTCLNGGNCTEVSTIDDVDGFHELLNAFAELGIDQEEYFPLFSVCTGILHLNNIEFEQCGDEVALMRASSSLVDLCCRLFQCSDSSTLPAILLTRQLNIRGEKLVKKLDLHQAQLSRDAIAKELYYRIFNWLIDRINRAFYTEKDIEVNDRGKAAGIGVLDIFGFEKYEYNSLEQLCINYANEKLQQQFTQCIFKAELKKCQQEEVVMPEITYPDNQSVINAFEDKPSGLFCTLDDEIAMPKASDYSFLQKLIRNHPASSILTLGKLQHSKDCFSIQHFAGQVQYNVQNFLLKNKDPVHEDILNWIDQECQVFYFPTSERRKKTISLVSKFRRQTDHLMAELWRPNAQPLFIKCIKPNTLQVPSVFDANTVMDQLDCAGIPEAVIMHKCGYPFQVFHAKFYQQYHLLSSAHRFKPMGDPKEACTELLQSFGIDSVYAIGTTSILWGYEFNRWLRSSFHELELRMAGLITRQVQRYLAQRLYREALQVKEQLELALAQEEIEQSQEYLDKAIALTFDLSHLIPRYRHTIKLLEERRRLQELLDNFEDPVKPDHIHDGIEQLLQDCQKINYSCERFVLLKEQYLGVFSARKVFSHLHATLNATNLVPDLIEMAITQAQGHVSVCGSQGLELLSSAQNLLQKLKCEKYAIAYLRARIAQSHCSNVASFKTSHSKLQAAIELLQLFNPQTALAQELIEVAESINQLRVNIQTTLTAPEATLPEQLQKLEEVVDDGKEIVVTSLEGIEKYELDHLLKWGTNMIKLYNDTQKHVAALGSFPTEKQLQQTLSIFLQAQRQVGLTIASDRQVNIETRLEQLRQNQMFGCDLEQKLQPQLLQDPLQSLEAICHQDYDHLYAILTNTHNSGTPLPVLSTIHGCCVFLLQLKQKIQKEADNHSLWADIDKELVQNYDKIEKTKDLNSNSVDLHRLRAYLYSDFEAIKHLVATKIALADLEEKLQLACNTMCEEWLEYGLYQATKVEQHFQPSMEELVSQAKDKLDLIRLHQNKLLKGTASRDPTELQEALQSAERAGLRGKSIQQARTVYLEIMALYDDVADASQMVDQARIKQVYQRCVEFGLRDNEQVDNLRKLVQMPLDQFYQTQFKMAIRSNNQSLAITASIFIKDEYFNDPLNRFEMKNYPNLRTTDAFGRVFTATMAKERLIYSTTPSGLPLTKLNGAESKKALNLFKDILGYCGDRHYSYPTMLAQDILVHGVESESLADEIYCLLMKQLTFDQREQIERLSGQSGFKIQPDEITREDKCRQLFALCLSTFSPSGNLVNYVEYFLRQSDMNDHVRQLHQLLCRRNHSATVPSLDRIYSLANPHSATRISGWLSKLGARSRFSRRRWFVLEGENLHYFRQDKLKEDALGVINLITLEKIRCTESNLQIELLTPTKKSVLVADTMDNWIKWTQALRSARAAYWDRVMAEAPGSPNSG